MSNLFQHVVNFEVKTLIYYKSPFQSKPGRVKTRIWPKWQNVWERMFCMIGMFQYVFFDW